MLHRVIQALASLKRWSIPAAWALALAAAGASPVWAWDAGTVGRTNLEGSGGENPISIVDTRPKWAASTPFTSTGRVSDCPAGYRNTGPNCTRDADTILAPSILATCPSGYVNTAVSCYREPFIYSAPSQLADCPSGYANTGSSCFRGASSYSAPSQLPGCTNGGTNLGLFCTTGVFTCSSGYFLAGARCNQVCQSGYYNAGESCQRDPDSQSLSVATCPSGYFKGVLNRCYVNCASGFTNTGEFCDRSPDTQPLSVATCPGGYFQGLVAGRCNVNCPSGYTNTGESCLRPLSSLGTSSMSCQASEQKIDIAGIPRCYTSPACPAGYEVFGVQCYVQAQATGVGGTVQRTAISTVIHNVKQGGNTHLWVTNRALDLLTAAAASGTALRNVVDQLNVPAVRAQWEQGLWDGDGPDFVDFDDVGSANNHQGTHFYNPVGLDRNGDATTVVTYTGATDNAFSSICTNARECAQWQLSHLSGLALDQVNPATGKMAAYHLGVALHYMTDLTQPMHTSGWYGASIPINGHPQWEYYVPYVQSLYPVNAPWNPGFLAASGVNLDDPDQVLKQAATRSNALAPPLATALNVDGGGGVVTIEAFNGVGPYTGYNLYNDTAIDALTGQMLREGYQSVAGYLAAVAKTYYTAGANDNFSGRTPLTGDQIQATASTNGGTRETGEPLHVNNAGGRSAWWTWTAPAAGTVTMTTAGSGFDTLLAVYTGSAVTGLVSVAANDDDPAGGTLTSKLTLVVTAGTVYQIAVDGFNGAFGNAVVSLSFTASSNDRFADRYPLTGASGQNTLSNNSTASREVGEPIHAAGSGGRSVWWRWVAPSTGTVVFDTIGTGFDTTLALYTGASVDALSLVASNDDDPGLGTRSRVTTAVTQGVEYQIAVDGYTLTEIGAVILNWRIGQAQTITFPAVPTQPRISFPGVLTVSPSASSGLTVGLASSTPSVCTVSGFTVTLLQAGQCVLIASQAGTATILPAATVQASFAVLQTQTIGFAALADRALGTAPFSVSATASSGLPVSYSVSTTSVCSVSGSTITLIATGTCTVVADQAGDGLWVQAPTVIQSFAVMSTGSGTGDGDVPLPAWALVLLGVSLLRTLWRRV